MTLSRRRFTALFALSTLALLPIGTKAQDTPKPAPVVPPGTVAPLPDTTTPITPTREIKLFNGKDFTGLYTFLPSNGLNNDPESIFKIEKQGRNNVIHVLGKEFGYFATVSPYADYHLTFQVKWGETKWPPREKPTTQRDSGVLVHVIEGDKVWPKSWECQIQERDFGDVFNLGVSSKANDKWQNGRIVRTKDNEKPHGEWNKVELIVRGNAVTNIVNGEVVNTVTDIHKQRDGMGDVLSAGRIAFQSEGAEVYYRNITMKPLPKN